jgi:hypothetical protein
MNIGKRKPRKFFKGWRPIYDVGTISTLRSGRHMRIPLQLERVRRDIPMLERANECLLNLLDT